MLGEQSHFVAKFFEGAAKHILAIGEGSGIR
jgi:hypothetical protein